MSDEPKIPFIAHDGSMVAWYIYLHEGLFLGEYTSPMDPMGWLNQKKVFFFLGFVIETAISSSYTSLPYRELTYPTSSGFCH